MHNIEKMMAEIKKLRDDVNALKEIKANNLLVTSTNVIGRFLSVTLQPNENRDFYIDKNFKYSLKGAQKKGQREFIGVQFRLLIDGIEYIPEDYLVLQIGDDYLGDIDGKLISLSDKVDDDGNYYIQNMDTKEHKFELHVLPWPKDLDVQKFAATVASNVQNAAQRFATTAANNAQNAAQEFATTAANNAQNAAQGFATTAASNAQNAAQGFATTAANNAQNAAQGFATTAANNAQNAAQGFATTAANNAQNAAQGFATTAVTNEKIETDKSIVDLQNSIPTIECKYMSDGKIKKSMFGRLDKLQVIGYGNPFVPGVLSVDFKNANIVLGVSINPTQRQDFQMDFRHETPNNGACFNFYPL